MPGTTLSIFNPTPMTPVDATSTASAAHPSGAAVSAAIVSAFARPSLPVQALAQPLFTTMARAIPCVRSRCCLETSTGAAFARFVVKSAAAGESASAAITAEIERGR
jgi:hypothetical protein